MYYPYLRGKQYELKALRELSEEDPRNNYLCPIIEPVKSNYNNLNTAIKVLKENEWHFVLVVNPSVGDFKGNTNSILANVEGLDGPSWKPGLLYMNNCEQLSRIIQNESLEDVYVIFKDGIDFDRDSQLEEFLTSDRINSVVVYNATNRSSKHKLERLGKHIIRLDEKFNEKRRNVDYEVMVDEQFTEEPFYYNEDGFAGFSDYTVLPRNLSEGGSLPYAIAIHLTYKPEAEFVYIHHFVSETNFDQSNIQGKFAEAAKKAVDFFNKHTDYYRGSGFAELEIYYNEGRYPGLGVIKKISIKHHLQLISEILKKNETIR